MKITKYYRVNIFEIKIIFHFSYVMVSNFIVRHIICSFSHKWPVLHDRVEVVGSIIIPGEKFSVEIESSVCLDISR